MSHEEALAGFDVPATARWTRSLSPKRVHDPGDIEKVIERIDGKLAHLQGVRTRAVTGTVPVWAIEQVKTAVPDTAVVAEMMSADWGRDQVVLAAQAGADIVQLIGPATTASVRAAVDAGRRLGVPVLLDVPVNTSHRWITDMERAGIDGLTVTTNIDVGIGSTTPLDVARELRTWTALPVSVSGGFSTTDTAVIASSDWDILIVGRSVADAVDPATAAKNLVELVHLNGRQQ